MLHGSMHIYQATQSGAAGMILPSDSDPLPKGYDGDMKKPMQHIGAAINQAAKIECNSLRTFDSSIISIQALNFPVIVKIQADFHPTFNSPRKPIYSPFSLPLGPKFIIHDSATSLQKSIQTQRHVE